MVSSLVKWHIKNKAKRIHKRIPEDIDGLLREELKCFEKYPAKIVFSFLWDGGGKFPNATATIPGWILLNAEWAAYLVLFQGDEDMHIAFMQTIAHELTHQQNDYFLIKPFSRNEKFIYWINEIHADFGSVLMAFNGEQEKGLRALRYKKNLKQSTDTDSQTHPSWLRRIQFMKEGCFDSHLIRRVAGIVGCANLILIEDVCNHYREINLKGS